MHVAGCFLTVCPAAHEERGGVTRSRLVQALWDLTVEGFGFECRCKGALASPRETERTLASHYYLHYLIDVEVACLHSSVQSLERNRQPAMSFVPDTLVRASASDRFAVEDLRPSRAANAPTITHWGCNSSGLPFGPLPSASLSCTRYNTAGTMSVRTASRPPSRKCAATTGVYRHSPGGVAVATAKQLKLVDALILKGRAESAAAGSLTAAAGTAVAPGGVLDDRSAEVALAMLAGDPETPPPATAAELRRWLEQPLGRPLPLDPVTYDRLRYDVGCHRVLHLVEATPGAFTLSATVFTALRPGPPSESEISLAVNLGRLIDALFAELQDLTGLLPHRLDHDTSDSSGVTCGLLRPDFCLWVDDTLVFKGEVMAISRDLRLAVDKLGYKMGHVWSPIAFGNLPYLPCYATAGSQLQFYALLKSQPQQPVSISKRFDLSVVADRVEVAHHVANLFRLLCWCLRPLLPPYPVTVGAVLERSHGTTITILTDRVVKRIENFASNNKGVEYDDLANVYGATRRAAGLIHATEGPTLSERKGTYKVTLAPLGSHRRPANEGELRRAIQDVLRGVAALHEAGYVHRDIRWENVLWIGQGSWMLSDLESVARPPAQTAGEGSFHAACWTDDTLDERGMYTTASDVQLVGRLIENCDILSLGAQCVELKAQLTASAAASRPSAVEALCHPWFSASAPL
ncbi:hypothetical protein VOLCADRAFT_93603 [Volvox carteri f. nagariensis]|uniref:Protein kinase domain-containing protein n=1 Tax=Volvox carteri f. nagariensis TaxID=3068 RepID=D8U2J6_VOLCA|nr:uncharacterized protein VOLCADRAFT_93603 [Volvox carteri f. nagariensis]EFJ46150.1 hypothetical protein VOLCADRAFT_93603 [Volvox carteri f. nagariensis]|eukprot:XP_002952900.1 hypothetical protein VOLCADRAFT_93603 [Volvox carteri f. nagariensis]